MSAAEIALNETHDGMGANVTLLDYLPTEEIRVAPFEDERSHALPVRMLFGVVKEGRSRDLEVWITMHQNPAYATNEKDPEYRFSLFEGDGNYVEPISAAPAVRSTLLADAFRSLKESGVVHMTQLSAVIKYYFIVKNVSPSLPWPIGAQYVNWLAAACKVARTNARNMAVDNEMKTMSKTVRRAAERKAADINLQSSLAEWRAQHSAPPLGPWQETATITKPGMAPRKGQVSPRARASGFRSLGETIARISSGTYHAEIPIATTHRRISGLLIPVTAEAERSLDIRQAELSSMPFSAPDNTAAVQAAIAAASRISSRIIQAESSSEGPTDSGGDVQVHQGEDESSSSGSATSVSPSTLAYKDQTNVCVSHFTKHRRYTGEC
jgi:hypothetical protein